MKEAAGSSGINYVTSIFTLIAIKISKHTVQSLTLHIPNLLSTQTKQINK
jgi:hypothetical protein